jgi:NAD(P)-dependent dehydrogenase (short-subunit alcohol dehydrogenase family)
MNNSDEGALSMMGRRAIVTGGASGLGLGIVERLVEHGAQVLAADIDDSGRGRVEKAGGRFVHADVSQPDDWDVLVGTTREALGGLDLLVLNAGIPVLERDVVAAPYERVARAYAVNVEGVIHGMRAGVPAMADGGDIVVVSSLAGLMPYSDDPYYAMTKHAVIGLARGASPRLAKRGVRVTVFCPGVVDTPLVPEHIRAAVLAAGLELLSPAAAGDHLLEALAHGGSGRIWTSQAHVGLVEYVPAPVEMARPRTAPSTA